jgi:predicted nucleic acid-binding protein
VTPDVDDTAPALLDTSAAVAIVFEDHEYHDAVLAALPAANRASRDTLRLRPSQR